MTTELEPAALDQWYAIARREDMGLVPRTRLLGMDLLIEAQANGLPHVTEARSRRRLPVTEKHGHLWTTPGTPARDILDIPELDQEGRRFAAGGPVHVRTSGLRVVENFLDMAHFPFVHGGLLGVEEHPEVARYTVEIREDVDEVWATKCEFIQPRMVEGRTELVSIDYSYRVSSPFTVVLYKSGILPDRPSIPGLFVQPCEPDTCIVHSFTSIVDDRGSDAAMLQRQQWVFLQDRIILENQRPRLLPLSPGAEIPTRADISSVAYRRWLKAKGLRFGTLEGPQPDAVSGRERGSVPA